MSVKHASLLLVSVTVLAGCEDVTQPTEPESLPSLDLLPTYTREAIWGVDYYNGTDPGPKYECPYSAGDVDFVFQGHSVDTDGFSIRVENLPPGGNGLPRAGYRLPPGPWDSSDGKIRIWSGIVRGWCRGRYVSFGFGQIWVGGMHWYEYEGQWQRLEDQSSDGGGTYAESSDGATVSDPDAQDALDAFLYGGVCTEGWDIYVDGEQVCANGIRLW